MNPFDYLESVAAQLGSVGEEFVFVGGMVRQLLVTDPLVPGARPTFDVDIIVEIGSKAAWAELEPKLRRAGLKPDMRNGAPVCRYVLGSGPQAITIDVMPLDRHILGFSNPWYPSAFATAQVRKLGAKQVRVIDAVHFVATKLIAFRERGKGDYYHHDLEDIVVVIDGRPEFEAELYRSPSELREFIATELRTLLDTVDFHTSLPGHLPPDKGSQARLPRLVERLEAMAQLQVSVPSAP